MVTPFRKHPRELAQQPLLTTNAGYRWPDQDEPAFHVVSLDAFSIGLSKTDVLPASGRVAFWLYTDDVDREIERLRRRRRGGHRRTSGHRMGRAHGHDF